MIDLLEYTTVMSVIKRLERAIVYSYVAANLIASEVRTASDESICLALAERWRYVNYMCFRVYYTALLLGQESLP